MAGRYTDFTLLVAQRAPLNGTLLRGSWAALLQWPAARRVESIDYPERDGKTVDFGAGLYDGAPRELRLPLYFRGVDADWLQNMLRLPGLELEVDALGYLSLIHI